MCEAKRWQTVPLSEAQANKEPFASARRAHSGDQICDVYWWTTVSVTDALNTKERIGRCIACQSAGATAQGRSDRHGGTFRARPTKSTGLAG